MRLNSRLFESDLSEQLVSEGLLENQQKKAAETELRKSLRNEYQRGDIFDIAIQKCVTDLQSLHYDEWLSEYDRAKMFEEVKSMADFLESSGAPDSVIQDAVNRAYPFFIEWQEIEEIDDENYSTRSVLNVKDTLQNFAEVLRLTGVYPTQNYIYTEEGIREIVNCPIPNLFNRIATGENYAEELESYLERYWNLDYSKVELIQDALGEDVDKKKIGELCFQLVKNYFSEDKRFAWEHQKDLNSACLLQQALKLEIPFDDETLIKMYDSSNKIFADNLKQTIRNRKFDSWEDAVQLSMGSDLLDIESLSGIRPDEVLSREYVLELYNGLLEVCINTRPCTDSFADGGINLENKLDILETQTGITAEFSQETIDMLYNTLLDDTIRPLFENSKGYSYNYIDEEKLKLCKEDLENAINVVQRLTRTKPVFTQQSLLGFYNSLLEYHSKASEYETIGWSQKIQLVEEVTNTTREFDEKKINEMYFECLKNNAGTGSLVKKLKSLDDSFGRAPLEFDYEAIQSLYLSFLDTDGFDRYGDFAFKNCQSYFEEIMTVTSIEPDFERMDQVIQNLYAALLRNKNNIYYQINNFAEYTGIPFDVIKFNPEIQKKYHSLLSEYLSDFNTHKDDFQKFTNVSPEWDREILQNLCKEYLEEGDIWSIKKIIDITGFLPDWPSLASLVQQYYFSSLSVKNREPRIRKAKILDLQNLCGIAPEFDNLKTQAIYRKSIWKGDLSELDEIFDITNIPVDYSDSEMQETVQTFYNTSLYYTEDLHSYIQRIAGLKARSGIEPVFDRDKLEKLYIGTIKDGNISLIEALRQLSLTTGISIDFELMKDTIQACYIKRINSNRGNTVRAIIAVYEVTGIPLIYDKLLMQDFISQLILNDNITELANLGKCLSKQPDFKEYNEAIQSRYNHAVEMLDFSFLTHRLKELQNFTGIEPVFEKALINDAYKKIVELEPQRAMEQLQELEIITGIAPEEQEVIEGLIVKCLSSLNIELIGPALKFAVRYKITPNWPDIFKMLRKNIQSNPRNVAEINSQIMRLAKSDSLMQDIYSAYESDPWLKAIARLQKLQGLNTNVQNDPWHTELAPLISASFSEGRLDLEKAEDAEFLVKYVEQMGMVNLPQIFRVFMSCMRAKRMDDIPVDELKLIEDFGIKLKRGNGEWRYDSPLLVINELHKATRNFQSRLVDDTLPDQIETVLGQEIFGRLRGSTKWDKKIHEFEDVISSLRQTLQDNPDRLQIPQAFHPATFKVSTLSQRREIDLEDFDADALLQNLFESKQIEQRYTPLAKNISEGLSKPDLEQWWENTQSELVAQLQNEADDLESLLNMTSEEISLKIEQETDEKLQKALSRKYKSISNPRAREGLDNQLTALKEKLEFLNQPIAWWNSFENKSVSDIEQQISQINLLLGADDAQFDQWISSELDPKKQRQLEEKKKELKKENGRLQYQTQLDKFVVELANTQKRFAMVADLPEREKIQHVVMELCAELGAKTSSALREATIRHMLMLMPDGFREDLGIFAEGYDVTSDRIKILANFSRQFIFEHYLHTNEDYQAVLAHSGHVPFSAKLQEELLRIWQLQEESVGKDKFIPIEVINNKVEEIINPTLDRDSDKISITMIPGAKILRIMAPYIGNMCATKQDLAMAQGNWPRLHAWVYVTNRGKSNESFRGSMFSIDTTADDGVPSLVGRGNNPRENFIQSIDAEQFVAASLTELVNVARRMREDRINADPNLPAQKRRQYVVVPVDGSGSSSTNRPLVASAYQKFFAGTRAIGLTNEPETNFNNYSSWNAYGGNACRLIWEIDENGKEVWHGKSFPPSTV